MKKLLNIRLDLFDGAAGAASGSGTGTGSAQAGAPAEGGQNLPGNTRQDSGEDLSKVIYGKQPEAGTGTSGSDAGDIKTTSSTLEEKRKAFRDMVNGEYKDQFTEETQRIINKRFKETKGLQETVDAQQPLIDTLSARYGVSDIAKLVEAVNSDTAFWAEAADAAGMTVEQYREFNALKRENERLLRAQSQQAADARVQAQLDAWTAEEQQLKAKFPSFSLAQEMDNPQFLKLLKAQIPMEQAFMLLHMDEMMNSAVNITAQNTERAVTGNIRARGNRPVENGTSSQSAFQTKADPGKWSKEDRKEVARRVGRGEHIEL